MAIACTQLSVSTSSTVFIASGENAVTSIIFCNVSSITDASIDVWMVPAGQAAGDNNKILNQIFIPAKETFSIDTERFILGNGDSISAQATQNSVITTTVSYMQLS
jgi:hypothetical protein